MIVYGCNGVKVDFCHFCRTNLCFDSYVIFIIRSARLKVTSFFIRIRFSVLFFVGVRSPFCRFLSLYEYFSRCFFCDHTIASPVTNGRHIFGIFLRVICFRINGEYCASLDGVNVNFFRSYFAGRNSFAFIDCFRYRTRSNGS